MTIPPFKEYFPDSGMMDRSQRAFYDNLKRRLDAGDAPAVDGNISYLFVYVYSLLEQSRDAGFESVHDRLLDLAERYNSEDKFADYCRFWAYDCLLATKQYDRYLELTEPADVFTRRHNNLRLNVQYQISRPAHPVDLLNVLPGYYTIPKGKPYSFTRTTREHPGQFRDILETTLREIADREGGWFDRMLKELGPRPRRYPHELFQGAPVTVIPSEIGEEDSWPPDGLPFRLYDFDYTTSTLDNVRRGARDAENRLREKLELPKVGEGWVGETELYKALAVAFSQTHVIQHGRPEWLGRQHFDVWFPRWKIAVERHGRQHFEPVEFFGGKEAFEAVVERDRRKANLAKRHGVTLIITTEETSHETVIEQVQAARRSKG